MRIILRKDIINENNPTASVNENPNIANVNKSDLNDGFQFHLLMMQILNHFL